MSPVIPQSPADDASANDLDPRAASCTPRSPCFLEKLMDIRAGDAVSGSTWRHATGLSGAHAHAMAHLDRSVDGLHAVLTLLQASEECRRRMPEDFGIGDDLHEGLLRAARELTHSCRASIQRIEQRPAP